MKMIKAYAVCDIDNFGSVCPETICFVSTSKEEAENEQKRLFEKYGNYGKHDVAEINCIKKGKNLIPVIDSVE